MHKLIATYLFQNKQCPLPGIGHLYVLQTPAQTDFLNKQLLAPQGIVKFSTTEIDSESFLDFAAKTTTNNKFEIKEQLQSLFSNFPVSILGVGNFIKENNQIEFVPTALNPIFLQSANAERVVHENAAHTMVVGDTETTTTAMTEYFAEEEIKKDYWWVWALVLSGISIVAICLYYFAGIN